VNTTRYIGFTLTGNLNGFVILDTHHVKNKILPPFVALEHLEIDGVSIRNFHSGINRKSEIKHFKLDLMATHTIKPQGLKLEHQLVGFEPEATIANNNINSIGYTNLGSGNYTLKYRAQSANGVWSEYVSLPINISKPFWLSLWAYIIYFALLILLITLIVKYRTAILEKQTKNLEKIVLQRTYQLKEALHQSQLLYTSISHEFRTPLTLILGPIELLKKQIDKNPSSLKLSNKEFQSIEENARRLLKLVDQLLSLAKSKVTKSLLKKPLNVEIKILAIIRSLESFAEVKKIKISHEINNELWLYANSEQFEFILLNLISNAIKFSPEQGTIKINAKQTGNDVFISVSDNGAGIDIDEFNKIFEPFYQIESEKNQYKGSGIGLLLVKEFVEINQGKIEVQSNLGAGTQFKLAFKAFSTNKDDSLDSSKQEILSELVQESIEQELLIINNHRGDNRNQTAHISAKGTKLTLLIIEDNVPLLEFIEQIFSDDYHVITAQNGEEGFTSAITAIPDVIITDVMMPKLDGISMCKKLALDQLTQHIPVILLTAKNDDASILEGFQNNAVDYVCKPFKVEWLKQKVKNLLDVIVKQRLINRNQLVKVSVSSAENRQLADSDSILKVNLRKCFEKKFSDPTFGVGELAHELSMSVRKLQRLTASLFDLTPNELLRDYRLSRAKVLLEKGSSVTATYLDCGFQSASYFSRAFKKSFGISPSRVFKIP